MIKKNKVDISSITKAKKKLDIANNKLEKSTNDVISICRSLKKKK